MLRERYERMLKFCELPAATEDWIFEKFDYSGPLREAYEAALELAEERGIKWLALVGPVDTGKSHLAVAICRRWLARGKPARYVLVPLMLEELRAAYQSGAYDRQMDFLLKVPLLVLDDLGTQKPTEWAMEKLMQVIDYRYVNALPLVVTTNKSLDNLPGDTEHRIGSRLLRATFGKVVTVNAHEYRLRKKK
jgi:DNA replication protein DnaC